ncbi:MAG: type III restriction endonuclease subunit R, partial [Candidatus Glassbacteria bacterium]|nr:type III restriction endonuclease subunit R [Candidatus Glassbacteria bacterium]
LVPTHLMHKLRQGRVLVTNWHVFLPQTAQTKGAGGKVIKAGHAVTTTETISIGQKTTTARGTRYLTLDDYRRQVAAGLLEVEKEEKDSEGNLKKVHVKAIRYVESDTSIIKRVLGREVGGKHNILVMNDEAHHAYRIIKEKEQEEQEEMFGEDEIAEEFFQEATVWIEGLDRIQKLRGINFCVDLSATPYFLGRVGQETNKPFPWVVSDFGLIEAIESGLVKIPQLAIRDTTGAEIPGYFNIWHWILPQLTPAERGPRKGSPKPEAILKYVHTPIAMLGGLWEEMLEQSGKNNEDPRPPVFIIVCKNTRIAKTVFEWIAENKNPTGIPPCNIESFSNRNGEIATIRVDSKVVQETDTGEAKSDESRWMRLTLDTIGKREWPSDRQGRPIYPEGFGELAAKLGRSLDPPGRDVRCIVSVGMLTEGWDCNTVTHIIGLRPFMSQLLCEQVVGRGLRRSSYDVNEENGLFTEEVAKVLGVPFEVIPFKAAPHGLPPTQVKQHHVHAIPEKASYEIKFPRVEGYTQAIRNKIIVDWDCVATLKIQPDHIPPEVEMMALSISNEGRLSLSGPGKKDAATLKEFREKRRIQELIFDLSAELTRRYIQQGHSSIPAHVLFPQVKDVVKKYVVEKVNAIPPSDKKDLFLSPYYGWLVERLVNAISPDTGMGEEPEIPIYESSRGPGSTSEVDFWTKKDVREICKSHLNYVVADTRKWEQSAAYYIDRHGIVEAFVKNSGLGFAIPYLHNGRPHDYLPDFIIRLKGDTRRYLILETKGYDPWEEIKRQAAERWVMAVNSDGKYGIWIYKIARKLEEINKSLDAL